MRQRYIMVTLALILMGLPQLAGAESGIEFSIRYFDRRVYHVDCGPILVQLTITNNSPAPFRFKLANERAFSVDFDVRTAANRPVEAAASLVRLRGQSRQVFFREVSLSTGESFSFIEDLRDYAAFTQAGSFVVQARLFPQLINPAAAQSEVVWQSGGVTGGPGINPGALVAASGQPLGSNRLALTIRPQPVIGPDGIPLELDVAAHAVLVRERLPPDEVVSYIIRARQLGHWERFFLYLDLEAMLTRDGYRRRQWLAESEEGRRRMLARYRLDLQNAEVDGAISLIPLYYVIERTEYTAREGRVIATQYFREGMFIQRKRYVWYLERRDEIWTVVDFSVSLLGAVDSLPGSAGGGW